MSAPRWRADDGGERVLQLEAGDEPALDGRPVGMADPAMIPHILAVADLRALVADRARRDAAGLEHRERRDAGPLLSDARIVEEDARERDFEREFAGADAAVRGGHDMRAGIVGHDLRDRVHDHDVSLLAVQNGRLQHGRASIRSWEKARPACALRQAAFGGLQMSLTDCSTAWGSNTRSSQSSRKMTGFACAIACSAPSENRPSGKISNAIASPILRWPSMKSTAALRGTPRRTASSVASRRAMHIVIATVSDSAGSRIAICSTVQRCASMTGL